MKCPKCREKYKKDTYVCSNCGTMLQGNKEKEIYITDDVLEMLGAKIKKKPEPLTLNSLEGYEVVFKTTSEMEANLIKSMLEEEKIKSAFLSGDPAKTFLRHSGELTIIVPESDYDKAHDIVKAYVNSLGEPSEISNLMWDDGTDEFDIENNKKEK